MSTVAIVTIIVVIVLIKTFVIDRKELIKNRLKYEKLTAGKTEIEKRNTNIGTLLAILGVGGLALGQIGMQGGMPSTYVTLGSVLSLIGGAAFHKRLYDMKNEAEKESSINDSKEISKSN